MNIWEILKIEPTKDQQVIDMAYNNIMKAVYQNVQTSRFHEIRDAYQYAMDYANYEYSYDAETGVNEGAQETALDENWSDPIVFDGTVSDGPFQRSDAPLLASVAAEINGPFNPSESSPSSPEFDAEATHVHDGESIDEPPGLEQPLLLKPDSVIEDIRKVLESLHEDEKTAVVITRELIASERYELNENKVQLEIEVLHLLKNFKPFPYYFASEIELLFDWNMYANPYPNNYQLSYIFKSVLREIARQRTLEHIIINYIKDKNSQHPSWKEVEKIIFGPFDESKLIDIVQGNSQRDGVGFIFEYIDSKRYHPEESPVSEETIMWWRNYSLNIMQAGRDITDTNRGKSNYTIWALIIIAFIGGGFAFNMNNYSYSNIVESSDSGLTKSPTASITSDLTEHSLKPEMTAERPAELPQPVNDEMKTAKESVSADTVLLASVADISPEVQPIASAEAQPDISAEIRPVSKTILKSQVETKSTKSANASLAVVSNTNSELDVAYANKNYKRVIELAEPLAEANNIQALSLMADLYVNGRGLKADTKKAANYYLNAAKQGDAKSQVNIALLYQKGKGVKKDLAKSDYWYRKAARLNHPVALNKVGMDYKTGRRVKKNYKQAVEYFSHAADQGNASAINNLGVMYMQGLGVKKNHIVAIGWFKQATTKRNVNAYINLGKIYKHGDRRVRNRNKSIKWFKKAAHRNRVYAMVQLGYLYSQKPGQARGKAIKWYEKAAKKGSVEAQNKLAELYSNSKNINQRHQKAAFWWGQSASNGSAVGQEKLARAYQVGKGVIQSDKKAAYWFEKSAKQGNAEAQLKLAQLYEYGGAKFKNISTAIRWYKMAAKNGNYSAKINLQRIKRIRYGSAQNEADAFVDEDEQPQTISRNTQGFVQSGEYAFEDDDDELEKEDEQ